MIALPFLCLALSALNYKILFWNWVFSDLPRPYSCNQIYHLMRMFVMSLFIFKLMWKHSPDVANRAVLHNVLRKYLDVWRRGLHDCALEMVTRDQAQNIIGLNKGSRTSGAQIEGGGTNGRLLEGTNLQRYRHLYGSPDVSGAHLSRLFYWSRF